MYVLAHKFGLLLYLYRRSTVQVIAEALSLPQRTSLLFSFLNAISLIYCLSGQQDPPAGVVSCGFECGPL